MLSASLIRTTECCLPMSMGILGGATWCEGDELDELDEDDDGEEGGLRCFDVLPFFDFLVSTTSTRLG